MDMRISVLKDMKEPYLSKIKEIFAFEDRYGTMNYYSRFSSNGVAWTRKDVGLTERQISYLEKRGIIERVKKDSYHIVPEIRSKLKGELREIDVNLRTVTNYERALEYSIHGGADARALRALTEFQERWDAMYDDIGWPMARAKEIIINAGADTALLTRLRESGLVFEVGDDEYAIKKIDEELLAPYLEGSFSTQDAVFEYRNVVLPMKRMYEKFIESLTREAIEDMLSELRDVGDVVNYTRHVMGSLYMDALLPIIQQYGMADVPVFSSEGRKITQTGFSLAYFGEPGTGKTFATDDFLRGNDKNGIPAHGIIGRMRYGEGMTPKKFISILEAYQSYPVDWIIPEFNDFFRYRGMVEKLKLVMEQREVSDETKKEVIKPYRVKSFFIVNYNTRVRNGKWGVTIDDPNFNAIEDRMICRVFVNTPERERSIYENMVRKISGDIDWYLSDYLRKHITYSYHVSKKTGRRVIISTADFVDFGNRIREIRKSVGVNVSNRIIIKGIQIAGAAALIGDFEEEVRVSQEHLKLALEFIREELITRGKKI